MARRPHELERDSFEFDHLHTDEGEPRQRRRPSKRSIAALVTTLTLLVAGAAMVTAASGSDADDDPLANTVHPIAGAPALAPEQGSKLNADLVDIAATRTGRGYWTVASDGGVFTFGDAHFHGSTGALSLAEKIVGMAPTRSGKGYWLVAGDGGVFAFGDAHFYGSLGQPGGRTAAPIVAISRTPSGKGYWLLGGDGGVFAFGDATFQGAATSVPHNAPLVAMTPSPSGFGYYLLAADGGVYAFGDARFAGSAIDGKHVATGIAVPSNRRGYMIARNDGSVVGRGGAPSIGANPLDVLSQQHPVVGITARRGGGAWLVRSYTEPPAPLRPAMSASDAVFLRCTRAHESDSAGGYRAVSPGGTYRGAYQFLRSTWNNVARSAGRGDLVGVDPAAASPADQDALAVHLFHASGSGPWGGRCA